MPQKKRYAINEPVEEVNEKDIHGMVLVDSRQFTGNMRAIAKAFREPLTMGR